MTLTDAPEQQTKAAGHGGSTLKSIGHNAVAKMLTLGTQGAASMILARRLGADDYGVVGIALVVIGLLNRFSEMGLSAAIVQRPHVDSKTLATAQSINALIGLGLFLAAQALAPLADVILHSPASVTVVRVLAFGFLINVVGFLPNAMLTREMRFAELRIPAVCGAVIRGVLAITCAIAGLKYWSIVIGTMAGNVVSAVGLRMMRPIRVKWSLDRVIGAELLRFGGPLLGVSVLVFAVFNIDNAIIGAQLGTAELGYYTVAMTWGTFVCGTLTEVVHSVLFPRFSREQADRPLLRSMYLRSLRLILFGAVLVNTTLFCVSDGFLYFILGKSTDRWMPALDTLRVLCCYGAVRAAMEPIGNVLLALGRPKIIFHANLIAVAVELAALPFVASRFGILGVGIFLCLAYATQWAIYLPFLRRELKIGPRDFLPIIGPSLGAIGVVMAAAFILPVDATTAPSAMILKSTVAGAVFVAVHELLSRGSIFREAFGLLKVAPFTSARISLAGPARQDEPHS